MIHVATQRTALQRSAIRSARRSQQAALRQILRDIGFDFDTLSAHSVSRAWTLSLHDVNCFWIDTEARARGPGLPRESARCGRVRASVRARVCMRGRQRGRGS
jgi:hypothetical protein